MEQPRSKVDWLWSKMQQKCNNEIRSTYKVAHKWTICYFQFGTQIGKFLDLPTQFLLFIDLKWTKSQMVVFLIIFDYVCNGLMYAIVFGQKSQMQLFGKFWSINDDWKSVNGYENMRIWACDNIIIEYDTKIWYYKNIIIQYSKNIII